MPSEQSARGTYRCHEPENDVAALLLTDPLFNRRLNEVLHE